jgi:homoserine O-succinyltransferase/O-acetyltransferase
LRGERETYPSMPEGYFDPVATKALTDFKKKALDDRREDVMEQFPAAAQGMSESPWISSATGLYRNWLGYIVSRMAEMPAFPATTELYPQQSGKRPAVS